VQAAARSVPGEFRLLRPPPQVLRVGTLRDVPDVFRKTCPLFGRELVRAERVDCGLGDVSELVVGEFFQRRRDDLISGASSD